MNNNDNETYFFRKIDFNNSHINNILSSFDQNNKYNTFDFSPLEKTKKNFINLKKNNTRNIFGNYTYNQRKVISLHKNINPNKNKRCKKINYEKPSKIINLMHRNELRNKLLTSKLYKLVEKTANENYLIGISESGCIYVWKIYVNTYSLVDYYMWIDNEFKEKIYGEKGEWWNVLTNAVTEVK